MFCSSVVDRTTEFALTFFGEKVLLEMLICRQISTTCYVHPVPSEADDMLKA